MPRVRIDSASDDCLGDGNGGGGGRHLRRLASDPCSGDEREEFEMQEDAVRSRDRLGGANSLDIPEDHKVSYLRKWKEKKERKKGKRRE